MEPILTVRVQPEPFDVAAETEKLTAGRTDIGAVVAFTGLCRAEEGRLSALELEHYPGMAEEEIERTAREAMARWPLMGVTAIHRHGVIRPGEPIVVVIATSSHRVAAFEAAEFLMDFLKTRAPFWKKEVGLDGSKGDWVDAREHDDAAAARWAK
jgi:molybdopterin synthase catalytic subunit